MNILIVVARDGRNPTSAGGDQYLTMLAEDLAAWGHELTIWCASHPALPRDEQEGKVRIVRLAPMSILAPVVWGKMLAGGSRPFDLVIEDLIGGARAPFAAALLSDRPHAGMWFQDSRPLFRATYSPTVAYLASALQATLMAVYRRGWALVCSEATRAWVLSEGMASSHVFVYTRHEPIPLPPSGPMPFSARRNRIVCIGNLRPLKRLHESIDLLARVRKEVADAELVIVGRRSDPEYLRQLLRRAAQPDVAGAVSIRTDVSDEEKFAILAEAKVLSIHSPIEGMGRTVIEAGIYGVPTVANQGVPSEVVTEDVNGRRLAIGDLAGYADATRRLLTDRGEWERLSQGAIEVAERFTRTDPDPRLQEFVQAIARGPA